MAKPSLTNYRFHWAHIFAMGIEGSTVAYCLRYLAPKREFASSSLTAGFPSAGWPDRYINVCHCGGLSMVLQLKDPLELFLKGREVFPVSVVLSGGDMTLSVESDVKPLPSFHSKGVQNRNDTFLNVITFQIHQSRSEPFTLCTPGMSFGMAFIVAFSAMCGSKGPIGYTAMWRCDHV